MTFSTRQSAFRYLQTITVSECCLIELFSYILFEKNINILPLKMASQENRHCANRIGTLSFPIAMRPADIYLPVLVERYTTDRSMRRISISAEKPTQSCCAYTMHPVVQPVVRLVVQPVASCKHHIITLSRVGRAGGQILYPLNLWL